MTKPLFNDFREVSSKEWKQKIQFDLKGADYNEALVYSSLEGIDIKPFYHQDEYKKLPEIQHPDTWKITRKIEVSDSLKGNQQALLLLDKGVESIHFLISKETINLHQLLTNIPSNIDIYIETSFLSEKYCHTLNEIASSSKLCIYLFTDIIGNLAATGNWFSSLKNDFQQLENIVSANHHLHNVIYVDTGLLQNAGATMVQQLAYAIAHANEYLNHFNTLQKKDYKIKSIIFSVSVGGNYFFEIAKLRTLRYLWKILTQEYEMFTKCYILVKPSVRNKTILDYNVNMLRTTTECMSAVLGGADSICNVRYDSVYNVSTEFSERIAINQLRILKDESYFDQVTNVAEGSYYIENLTVQLAEKALELFKNIEKGGGYLKQLKKGIIQKKIKESAQKEQALFDSGAIKLTGSNTFKNANAIIPEYKKSPFLEKKERKTLLAPIVTSRLTEKIEKKLK